MSIQVSKKSFVDEMIYELDGSNEEGERESTEMELRFKMTSIYNENPNRHESTFKISISISLERALCGKK
jgi:hypothetical protein